MSTTLTTTPARDYGRPDLMNKLSEGITVLTTSDQWTAYLDCQSRFGRYSFNNTMLILMQFPEATKIAGFNLWKTFGRSVQKGEKALWILAPMIYQQKDENGEKHPVIRGFKFVPVFDVSQTEGDPLPAVASRLNGDDPDNCFDALSLFAQSIGYTVQDHPFGPESSRNGDCTYSTKSIRVEITNSPAQRVKTLAHELGHAILHEGNTNRSLGELEAESVAYIVCQSLRIDSSDYSFGYVAGWAGGGDEALAAIKASGERIQKTADAILKGVEAR